MSPTAETAVEIRGLRKAFGAGATRVAALAGVDLDIPIGQFLAVMGPSGSGKSTLLHLVAGLDQPDAGSIRVCGQDILALTDDEITLLRRRRLGLVFQAFNLLNALTAAENVSLPLVVDGVPDAEAHRRALEALERVGLRSRGRHLPKEMSGGEQQRVAIARALAIRPVMLLADEPTGNLDTHNGDQVMRLLRQLVGDGQTILMVTHNPAHAAVADRIVTLRDGNIMHDRLLGEESGTGPRGATPAAVCRHDAASLHVTAIRPSPWPDPVDAGRHRHRRGGRVRHCLDRQYYAACLPTHVRRSDRSGRAGSRGRRGRRFRRRYRHLSRSGARRELWRAPSCKWSQDSSTATVRWA